MKKHLRFTVSVAAGLLLAGCAGATPAAQTVVSTIPTTVPTTVVSTVSTVKTSVDTSTVTVTETPTEDPAADFDPVHVDVRTAASPAFDGWPNDVMDRIEGMVCKIYTPTDATDAAGKAGTVSAILSHLGISDPDANVLTFKTIVTNVCPSSLGYLPAF